jgi:uncharacterized protein YjbI with pentapeptide repeats
MSANASSNQFGSVRYTQAQIEAFIAAHERFCRREPNGKRAVMRFLQAQGKDLSHRLLADCDFTGGNFSGARLVGADFERGGLYCADLRNVDARCANFHRADLRGCSLRDADLTGARLDDADMREAMLAKEDLEQGFQLGGWSAIAKHKNVKSGGKAFAVDFTNCSMKRVQLGQAKLKGADFSGALLHGADLKGAVLDGARFEGTALIDVDLGSVKIDPASLAKCVLSPSKKAQDRAAELRERVVAAARWIVTNGAEGQPAVLDGEDLRPLGALFENAPLTALSARRALGLGSNFRGAQLQGANFEGADLRDADFCGADLRGASFRGANLSHALFHRADIRPLALPSGDRLVDLTGAMTSPDAFAHAVKE